MKLALLLVTLLLLLLWLFNISADAFLFQIKKTENQDCSVSLLFLLAGSQFLAYSASKMAERMAFTPWGSPLYFQSVGEKDKSNRGESARVIIDVFFSCEELPFRFEEAPPGFAQLHGMSPVQQLQNNKSWLSTRLKLLWWRRCWVAIFHNTTFQTICLKPQCMKIFYFFCKHSIDRGDIGPVIPLVCLQSFRLYTIEKAM